MKYAFAAVLLLLNNEVVSLVALLLMGMFLCMDILAARVEVSEK